MNLKFTWVAGFLIIGVTSINITQLSAQNPPRVESQSPQRIIFQPKVNPQTGVGWEITTTSGPAELSLAQHRNQFAIRNSQFAIITSLINLNFELNKVSNCTL